MCTLARNREWQETECYYEAKNHKKKALVKTSN